MSFMGGGNPGRVVRSNSFTENRKPGLGAMTMKFDAEQLYKALSDYSERKSGRPPLFTKPQRVFLYIELASFVLAILSALVGRYFPLHTKPFQWAALLFVLITQLSGLLAMAAGIWPSIRFFKQFLSRPVRTFILPLSARTQSDHDFAEEL